MTDNLVIPESSITIAGQEYKLSGSLKTLKDIQHAFDEEILNFIGFKLDALAFDKLAKLFAIGIGNVDGQKSPALDVIEQAIVDELGIRPAAALAMAWLVIAVTPKADRQKKTAEMQAILKAMQSQ